MGSSAVITGTPVATPTLPIPNGPVATDVPVDMRLRVFEQLLALKPLLEKRGSFQPLPQPGRYRLRVRADGRFPSISFANNAELAAARLLIGTWRQARAARDAERERRGREEQEYTRQVRQLRRKVLAAAGGGWRRRRRIGHEFDNAARDALSLAAYISGASYLLPNRRSGRPRRGGLA